MKNLSTQSVVTIDYSEFHELKPFQNQIEQLLAGQINDIPEDLKEPLELAEPKVEEVQLLSLPKCTLEICEASFMIALVIVDLLGYKGAKFGKNAGRVIAQKCDVEALGKVIMRFPKKNLWGKAKVIAKVGGELYRGLGLKGFIGLFFMGLSSWDYVVLIGTLFGQLTVWFASDGIALVAKLALSGFTIANAVTAAKKLDACINKNLLQN